MADDLTGKQHAFILAYLGEAKFNATEAARRAGYKGNDVTLGQVGAENLKKPQIAEAIAAFWRAKAMPAEEVLSRLAEQARASLKPFTVMFGEDATIDLTTVDAEANFHLIKKIKQKRRTYGQGDSATTEFETEIEIHDPQAALVHIGRHHKLFTDRQEQTGADGGPIVVKVLKGVSMDDL